MLWRYVKAQACGTAVRWAGRPDLPGRVFRDPARVGLLKWMFWVGLLITAADILIALALANYGAKSAAKTQALEQRACWRWPRSPASARRVPGSTTSRW